MPRRLTHPDRRISFQWHAEAIDKIYDEVAPTGPGDLAIVTRVPLGVVGCCDAVEFPAGYGDLEGRRRVGCG